MRRSPIDMRKVVEADLQTLSVPHPPNVIDVHGGAFTVAGVFERIWRILQGTELRS